MTPQWTPKDGTVTVPEVVAASGLTYAAVRKAIGEGLVTPTPVRRGHGGAKTLTVEDATLILIAAGIALAAGIAFVTILKVIRETGGTVGPTGVTIPIPGTVQ